MIAAARKPVLTGIGAKPTMHEAAAEVEAIKKRPENLLRRVDARVWAARPGHWVYEYEVYDADRGSDFS